MANLGRDIEYKTQDDSRLAIGRRSVNPKTEVEDGRREDEEERVGVDGEDNCKDAQQLTGDGEVRDEFATYATPREAA